MGELLVDLIWRLIEWLVELSIEEQLKPYRVVL
jgi:hypothetical protein